MTNLVLVASLAGQGIAIRAEDVISVTEIRSLVPVPHAPARIAGLAALRSQVLTVIDCALSAGLDRPSQPHRNARAVIVERDEQTYALMVDEVADVTSMLSDELPLPSHIDDGWKTVSKGLVETDAGLMLLVDVDAMIFGAAQSRAA